MTDNGVTIYCDVLRSSITISCNDIASYLRCFQRIANEWDEMQAADSSLLYVLIKQTVENWTN